MHVIIVGWEANYVWFVWQPWMTVSHWAIRALGCADRANWVTAEIVSLTRSSQYSRSFQTQMEDTWSEENKHICASTEKLATAVINIRQFLPQHRAVLCGVHSYGGCPKTAVHLSSVTACTQAWFGWFLFLMDSKGLLQLWIDWYLPHKSYGYFLEKNLFV